MSSSILDLCVDLLGMDPFSRRSTWELLQKKKKDRVIILTTHFLEEAEILGDRVVIMSDGKLRCSGSTLFLKSQFGAGYMLTITRDVDTVNKDKGNKANKEAEGELLGIVQSHVPTAKLYSSIGAEMLFELPAEVSHVFPALFATMKKFAQKSLAINSIDNSESGNNHDTEYVAAGKQSDSAGLRISSYGVQYVTLEQVFIRLATAEKQNDETVGGCDQNVTESVNQVEAPLSKPNDSILQAEVVSGDEEKESSVVLGCEDAKKEVEMITMVGVDEAPGMNSNLNDDRLGHDSSPRKDSQVMPIEHYDDIGFQPIGEDLDSSPQFIFSIQLIELFRKRFIIATRDRKGLFFQILIPAIQIALVLAVLTIDVNPAGRSLSMRADIYEDTVTAVLSDNATMWQPEDVRELLDSGRMDFSETNTTTSSQMSEHMLDTYTTFKGQRFGGYVYDDAIDVNVTVEWKWVRDNMPFLLNNFDLLSPFFDFNSFNLVLGNSTFLADLNLTSTTPAVDNALDAIFGNATFITINNVTIFRSNITDFIDDSDNLSVGGDDSEFSYDSIKVVDGDIVLVGVELVFNNNTFSIGNVTIAAEDVNSFLPNSTISYATVIRTEYSVLQNSTSPHAVGVFISELMSAAFSACTGDESASYSLRNHPLPLTIEQAIEIRVILSVLASLFILIPLCYIPASFVIFIVKERTSKSKHLQLVSGISPYLYWVASYLWDAVMYLLLAGFIMLTFFFYGEEAAEIFIGSTEAGWAVYLLLVFYGLASIPLSYIYSLAFNNHSTAQISIMTWNFFTGFVFVLAYYIMVSIPSTAATAAALVHVFRIFPPYNIGEGLINISVNYFNIFVLDSKTSYFAWTVTGRNLTFLAAQSVVYFSIILLSEVAYFRAVYTAIVKYIVTSTTKTATKDGVLELEQEDEDDDVLEERQVVQSADPSDYILFIKNIKKTYSSLLSIGSAPKYAVRGINLTCAAGERFGKI